MVINLSSAMSYMTKWHQSLGMFFILAFNEISFDYNIKESKKSIDEKYDNA